MDINHVLPVLTDALLDVVTWFEVIVIDLISETTTTTTTTTAT